MNSVQEERDLGFIISPIKLKSKGDIISANLKVKLQAGVLTTNRQRFFDIIKPARRVKIKGYRQ